MKIKVIIDKSVTLEHGYMVLKKTHSKSKCKGTVCTIHNMTDHAMRSWPQIWNPHIYAMERFCSHGIGHTDPDEYNTDSIVKLDHIEKCDGCCKSA